ncbi:MAG: TRAP transporter substrate-binding protein, partial [Hoeflea sp.]|nr:TRAP transporter substrate-binding protein [Hoeflea sp.]
MTYIGFFGHSRQMMVSLTASAALAVAAVSMTVAPSNATDIKVGYGLPATSHFGDAATAFGAKLEELSGGEFTISQFPDSQLGSERAMVEGLQVGSIDVAITSTGPVGNFVPEVQLFDIPFLFRDYDHARSIQDGPIGQELLKAFEPAGLIALAWGDAGFRHFTNNARPVRTPADIAGLKHRVMENDSHILAFETLGSLPTPMSFTELYTALQNGTLDGQENPISVIIAGKLFEVQDHLSLTSHALTNALVLVSPVVWGPLDDEQKGWFREAALAAQSALRARIDSDDANGLGFLRDQGMQVVEDPDRDAFQ